MMPGSRLVPLLEKLAVITVPGGDGTSSWTSSLARARRKSFRSTTANTTTTTATARMATIKTVFTLLESSSSDSSTELPVS
eukprot:jgi/Phyca11/511505/fgenesh2_kg.PHYCAscaffold_87_\